LQNFEVLLDKNRFRFFLASAIADISLISRFIHINKYQFSRKNQFVDVPLKENEFLAEIRFVQTFSVMADYATAAFDQVLNDFGIPGR
jgi:hypothetical protein